MDMFPHHSAMMKVLITDDNAMSEIPRSSGTIDAAITLGLWLDHTTPVPTSPSPDTDYMAYHHVLTLCAVFHPAPKVRQAASILAGLVLHRNPDDADRLRILEDILENCSFPALSACAVSWLREELMRSLTGSEPANRFSTPEALEHLQYCVFPNLASLLDASPEDIWDFWAQNAAFHLQVTNFAYFVFQPAYRNRAVPDGMRAAVEERYLKPLRHVSSVVKKIASQEKLDGKATMLAMEADILGSRIDMALAA